VWSDVQRFEVADPAALPEVPLHLATGEIRQSRIDLDHRRSTHRGLKSTTSRA
jgi:hypothetical protein